MTVPKKKRSLLKISLGVLKRKIKLYFLNKRNKKYKYKKIK